MGTGWRGNRYIWENSFWAPPTNISDTNQLLEAFPATVITVKVTGYMANLTWRGRIGNKPKDE